MKNLIIPIAVVFVVALFLYLRERWREYVLRRGTVREAVDTARKARDAVEAKKHESLREAHQASEDAAKAAEFLGGSYQDKTVWIPEAPDHPGLYANAFDLTDMDPVSGQLQVSTTQAYKAKWFRTREWCQRWCDAHPTPKFEPREHAFDPAVRAPHAMN